MIVVQIISEYIINLIFKIFISDSYTGNIYIFGDGKKCTVACV